MKQDDLKKVNNHLKGIIGSQGLIFGRAAGIAWVIFKSGDLEYALHLQCCFRIRDDTEIIVTNLEMFHPSESALSEQSYDPSTFHWDTQGANRYDEWVKSLSPDLTRALTVVDARANSCGDLTILFEQNIILEAFVDCVTDECWRLFEASPDSKHLVMLGSGPEKD